MCEQTEADYLHGEVVWVKLGSCWWPGEVVATDKLPPDVLPSFRKPPIACVKFFQEDAYEFVKNINNIYKYNCSRKNEFINKGLYLFRTKHGHMEKFPDDVIRAETAVGGDIEILTRDEFQETKKESYAGLFGNPKKTPVSIKKGKNGRGKPLLDSPSTTPRRQMKEKTDYKVHILVQGSKPAASFETSCLEVTASQPTGEPETTALDDKPLDGNTTESESQQAIENNDQVNKDTKDTDNNRTPKSTPIPSTPLRSTPPSTVPSSSGIYSCHACPFTTTRLNVLILHNKSHSVSFIPYTPSPVRKKPKSPVKSTPNSSKPRKPKKERTDKVPSKKRASGEKSASVEAKKPKTDEEIKSSLLADWDDDVDEESNDESSAMVPARSPEIAVGAESPAVPTPEELPSAQVPAEMTPLPDKKSNSSPSTEKPESSSDSKYEFCEDEDWPEETDFGRKIPRVKNPVRTEDPKNALDEDEVAREVAELLNKTAVPELPTVPEPLRIEENFPEPSVAKSPDKNLDKTDDKGAAEVPATKAIFKTKTFFRSRHSRSQDAIGKYVAEQLNAVERMDISESDMNGSEAVSSPEARDSPPIEPVKVAKLAPKIQLKKMKAEAAQLREKEKLSAEEFESLAYSQLAYTPATEVTKNLSVWDDSVRKDENDTSSQSKPVQDVIYPTQEIKPLNEDMHKRFDTEQIQESCTDKDLLMQEKSEKVKEPSSHEYETVMKSNFEEELPRLEEDTSISKKESSNYEKKITQENTSKVNENNVPFENERSNDGEVVIQSPVYEFEKETPNTEEMQTSTSKETSKLEEEAMLDELTAQNYVKTIEDGKDKSSQQCYDDTSETHEEIIPIQEPEVEKPLEPITKLDKSQLTKVDQISEPLNNEPSITKPEEQASVYMNESTASAVDALLSVSRETDRVPRVVSNDLPEDLFEDDRETDGTETSMEVNHDLDEKMDVKTSYLAENGVLEHMDTEEINHQVVSTSVQDHTLNDTAEVTIPVISHNEEIVDCSMNASSLDVESNNVEPVVESEPSESDLQVAEALINLPATAIQNTVSVEHKDSSLVPLSLEHESNREEIVPATDNVLINDSDIGFQGNEVETETIEHIPDIVSDGDNSDARFQTEQEESENLNAAQSLVQMSESIEHKVNVVEPMDSADVDAFTAIQNNGLDTDVNSIERNLALITDDSVGAKEVPNTSTQSRPSSRLLKILEEPCKPKIIIDKTAPVKQIVQTTENILNFDVSKSVFNKNKMPKQKIIIRRNPTSNRTLLNKTSDPPGADDIVLSRSGNRARDGASVQTFTIQTSPDAPSDANTIIIQQKIRKISKPAIIQPKLQKIKPQTSLAAGAGDATQSHRAGGEDAMFDISSMPVVLSEELLTAETIQRMPLLVADAPHQPPPHVANKLIKPKQEHEKVVITSSPLKSEVKTLLLNPAGGEGTATKSATPNILSKSSKLRGAKPMLVIDKTTGKQKIIMTKSEPSPKDTKRTQPSAAQPSVAQAASDAPKADKYIILPTQGGAPRPARTQKIVIDPQTGKAHMFVAKGPESPLAADTKPVSARLLPAGTEPGAAAAGNTVMIITNAQGAQSRIVLTPRHEKILFPNKQQPSLHRLQPATHRAVVPAAAPAPRAPARIVPKQTRSAIITSKGQLIVGGRVATAAHNIAPVPELRPVAPRRLLAAEPKRVTQIVQKTNSEPIIFLQQKSGAVMQLTAAQFEHLQRTGQIVQRTAAPAQEKIAIQKAKPAAELAAGAAFKRGRKPPAAVAAPPKKAKQEVAIAPAITVVPALAPPPAPAPLTPPAPTSAPDNFVPAPSNVVCVVSGVATSTHSGSDNYEELLPSTAISRAAPELPAEPAPPAPVAPPAPPALSEQILAVPGEHFGAQAGTFYLCVEENGTYTPIDNRPLVLERDQLVPAEPPPPERRDILEAALANSEVFRAEAARDEPPDFRDLNATVSVHCRVSETSSTLDAPIMSPAEVPAGPARAPADLRAVLGVPPPSAAVPTSLELPITVTDPRLADPRASCSMPLLADEDAVGKSMPILTEEAAAEGAGGWSRRAPLTPAPAPAPADLHSRS